MGRKRKEMDHYELRVLSVEDAARVAGVSEKKILEDCSNRYLPHLRDGNDIYIFAMKKFSNYCKNHGDASKLRRSIVPPHKPVITRNNIHVIYYRNTYVHYAVCLCPDATGKIFSGYTESIVMDRAIKWAKNNTAFSSQVSHTHEKNSKRIMPITVNLTIKEAEYLITVLPQSGTGKLVRNKLLKTYLKRISS